MTNDMRVLARICHPDVPATPKSILLRNAARGIVLRDDKILLLYTKRYDDFSLPGGGVDDGEDLHSGLRRELQEETGAQNIQILSSFGRIDEERPYRRNDFDTLHMKSYVYHCDIDDELGNVKMEHYEEKNGMKPLWVNIHEALRHNQSVMKSAPVHMGQSIPRETLLLERIISELI